MKFFDRLSSGLVNPKRVKSFSNDKAWLVILYFIFLVILSLAPIVITVVTTDYLSYDTQVELRSVLVGEDVPFIIQDNELKNVSDNKLDYYSYKGEDFAFYFTDQESFDVNNLYLSSETFSFSSLYYQNDLFSIIMTKKDVYISYSHMQFKVGSYSSYSEFEGLDFTNTNPNNSDLWEPLMLAYHKILNDYITIINVSYILMYLVSTIVALLLLSLFITLISRIGYKLYSFKDNWKLVIYCLVPYVVGSVLTILVGYTIFRFIGLVVTMVYSVILNRVGGVSDEL